MYTITYYTIAIFLLLHLLHIALISSAITEAQLKASGKLLRKNCQPKTKTSDESIENMHKGEWDDLPSTKVNKKGVFDDESALSQLEMLPKPRQEPTWNSAQKCKNECDGCTDKCERAYAMMKCFYFDNPENYFAP